MSVQLSPWTRDLSGQTFGSLKVLDFAGYRGGNGKPQHAYWTCQCKCGGTRLARGTSLYQGKILRCAACSHARGALAAASRRCLPTGVAVVNMLVGEYRRGATLRGLPVEITRSEFEAMFALPCHYCGTAPCMERRTKRGESGTFSGVDRVDSAKGYVAGNCVPCCSRCNVAKSDMRVADFIAWAKRLVSFQEARDPA